MSQSGCSAVRDSPNQETGSGVFSSVSMLMPSSTTVTTAVSPTTPSPRASTSTVTVAPPSGAHATAARTWTSSALSRVRTLSGTRP